MAEKLAPEKKHSFIHNGQRVFDWDQTLEEVNMYISLPPNVPKKLFYCKIGSKHVEVGIKGNPPYLNHDLTAPVKTDCSFWTLVAMDLIFTSITCDKLAMASQLFWSHGSDIILTSYIHREEDEILHLTLQKRDKGQTWSSPIVGEGQLDPYTTDLEQKRLMLQRFQEENPGFDFSQAQFNGNCPDPRNFMGGINSS